MSAVVSGLQERIATDILRTGFREHVLYKGTSALFRENVVIRIYLKDIQI